MSDVDTVKLSRWWGKALETEFEDEELERKFFCQFCVYDAKFCANHEEGSDDCDWWTGLDRNKLYKKFYYKDQILRACKVRISPLTLPSDPPDEPVQLDRVHSRGQRTVTKCVYCGGTFENKFSAFRHALQDHGDIKRYSCAICKLNFLSEDEKKTHMKKFHPYSLVCHLCKMRVKPISLLQHISEIHSDREKNYFECCGEKFSDQDALANHFKSVILYKSAPCIYCGKVCLEKSHLGHHMRSAHKDVAIKCIYGRCGRYFFTEDERQRHTVEVHESKSGLVQCPYCPLRVRGDRLSKHVSLSHPSEAIRCTFNVNCPTYFTCEKEREEHEQKVHLTARVLNRPKCTKCGKMFAMKNKLREHFEKEHELNATICKIRGCFEYFLSSSEVKNHFREKHSEDASRRKFQCDKCTHKTKTPTLLSNHIASKHMFDNVKCEKCGKVCSSRRHLLQHFNWHHGERKRCPHCHVELKCLLNHFRIDPCTKCGFVAACKDLKKLHSKDCKLGVVPK